MRSAFGQAQEQAPLRPAPDIMPAPAAAPAAKEIPYDYVAKFTLLGKRGNRVQDVINISIEGAFVAAAIGYSFIPAQLADLSRIPVTLPSGVILGPPGLPPTTLNEIIAETIADQLQRDIRYERPKPPAQPGLPAATVTPDRIETAKQLASVLDPLFGDPRMLIECFLTRLCGIDFKYSIVDSGTGRELQNQPIHNIAGLGEANGERPFRPLAKPMLFLPRSTIRIEVEEISVGPLYTNAELFIVLHGYKMLGYGTAMP
jgi:hypothetical protein